MNLPFRLKELLVPLLVIGVLSSILLPVPPWILDSLIVSNLILAIGLLVTALQISEPLKLSALPTILLLCTLYRLCLNISTTRLILGNGQGGQVVETFGSFVVGGSLGVGFVVFLILTFIQFIVVAKGSERVAEVAARFTLDAMPGKQMAIDADVRAGMYDVHVARQKRQELQTESRFYGALDGAMKFVKGDSIAGIFIVAVNIVGGFCIGLFNGMSFQQSLHTYTLLTVGDGLSSQIPSLLNSLAAGLVVTRVGQGSSHSLSEELLQQLMQSRLVVSIAAGFALLLACVPGMPFLPLIGIGGALACATVLKERTEGAVQKEVMEVPRFRPRNIALLEVRLSQEHKLTDLQIRLLVEEVKKLCYEKAGILIGNFEVAQSEENELSNVLIRGIPTPGFTCPSQGELSRIIADVVSERRLEFMDDNHSRRLLDTFEGVAPEVVSHLVPHILTLTQLTEVLKNLARESVSLCHFDLILQAITESAPKAGNDRILLEEIRGALSRIICDSVAGTDFKIRYGSLSPEIDLEFAEADRTQNVVAAELCEEIIASLERVADTIRCIVVSRGARRKLAEVLQLYDVKIPVLSYNEITSDFSLEQVVEIDRQRGGHNVVKLAA